MKTVEKEEYVFDLPNGQTLTLFDKETAEWLQQSIDDALRYSWITSMWPNEITRLVHSHHTQGPTGSNVHVAIKAAMKDNK